MAPKDFGSRPATPNAFGPSRMASATPSTFQQESRPVMQLSDTRRPSQIACLGELGYSNERNASPRPPTARMYDDHQGGFTPGRNNDTGNDYSRASSYAQDAELGDGRNVLGGNPYSQGAQRNKSSVNGYGNSFNAVNHGYNGYQNSGIGSPAPGPMNGMSNGGQRAASGGRGGGNSNANGDQRPFTNAGQAHPRPIPEPVAQRPSVYPLFNDGDVRIVSPSGKVWKLHSIILRKASPVLQHFLDTTAPYNVTKRMKDENNFVKWNIFLIPERRARTIDPEGLKFMSFERINPKDRGLTIMTNHNGLGETTGYNKLYDNFFRCVYNMEPQFTNDNDPQARFMIIDATSLLQAADWLEALACVRLVIEANFLRLNQALWKHIEDRPEGWIHISARLQSPLMFRECLVHLVGKYHLEGSIDRDFICNKSHGPLTDKIWKLIVQKAAELKDKKLRVERILLEFFPVRMIHKEDTETIPGRAIYAADIYLWQAIVIFRQFISSAFFSNFHHKAKDAGLAFYRTLGAGDSTYLRADTLDKFHQSFDMSPKAKGLLITALEQIKAEAKNVVAELLVDHSQLVRAPKDPPRDHLACIEILDEEMPWAVSIDGEDI